MVGTQSRELSRKLPSFRYKLRLYRIGRTEIMTKNVTKLPNFEGEKRQFSVKKVEIFHKTRNAPHKIAFILTQSTSFQDNYCRNYDHFRTRLCSLVRVELDVVDGPAVLVELGHHLASPEVPDLKMKPKISRNFDKNRKIFYNIEVVPQNLSFILT